MRRSMSLRRLNATLLTIASAMLVSSCGGDKKAEGDSGSASGEKGTPIANSSSSAKDTTSPKDTVILGPVDGVPGVTVGGDCPDPGPGAEAEVLAQAQALIPLKVGLTLSHIWRAREGDYDHECLEQVIAIDVRGVTTTGSCPYRDRKPGTWTRRVCRTDMRNSYVYQTSEDDKTPPVIGGTLKFSLSSASFAALKKTDSVHHRYVDVMEHPRGENSDIDGVLKSDGKGTFSIIVNDQKIEVPTIEAAYIGNHKIIRVKVLADERFPLMLDYYMPVTKFFITYTKVSYPGEIEEQLRKNKKTDVYGIYFDFASDSIRAESEPILREIGAALASNKDWTLTINGHTDSVGTAASNRILSEKRSAAVRKALVERYKVDSSRLTTSGFGSSQPKDVNSTDIGRARNRRVELIRQ